MRARVKNSGSPVLFRGQNQVYPTIKPSLARLPDEEMRAMAGLCRWFMRTADGVTGYRVPSEHDKLAILQHYIGRSPVIDLTGTPEVALYFALLNDNAGEDRVVYAIDPSACDPTGTVFSEHDFLLAGLEDGGLRHRWLRQDGYSVGPRDWKDLSSVRRFDLLKLPGVESLRFEVSPEDSALLDLGDLEDISSDPLALSVRGAVTATAQGLGLLPLIEGTLRASKTHDPHEELRKEIGELLGRARKAGAPAKVISTLENLRTNVGKHWDVSFDAALDWARAQMSDSCGPTSRPTR
jgi:hypothetical protein